MSSTGFLQFAQCRRIVLCLLTSAVQALGANVPERSASWEDRNHFPEAYGILTSDRVMFPDNVADWPLKIDSTHQLFVDDYLISEIDGLSREFHQPVKHSGNPLMPGGYVGVLYESDRGQFRMWNGRQYFTSGDGIHWHAPALGPKGNELFGEGADLRGFMYNPHLPEQDGRYKAVVEWRYNEKTGEPGGFYLFHSRDGLTWSGKSETPILHRTINVMKPCAFRPQGNGTPREFQWGESADHFQSNGVGDTSTFRYDTVLRRYIFDGKFILVYPPHKLRELGIVHEPGKPHLRLRTFSESEDLIHWSPPRFLMYPDRSDPPDRQIYAHVGFVYESMWIGVIQAMRIRPMGWKQCELQLSYSRDGRHWLRPQQREPFIPLGGPDSWDADYSVACYTPPVQVGEELFFYYGSSRNPARDGNPGGQWPLHIGLARLRRDGYASLNAGDKPGQIMTRPLNFKGNNLFVNAEVADGGWVKAAVLTRDSRPVSACSLDDSVPLTKGTARGLLTWKAKDQLEPPGDDHLRILFQLKNARLYSFWIE